MKLIYLKGSKEMAANCGMPKEFDSRLWNIVGSPRPDLHPDDSSISIVSLKEMEIIK